MGEPRLVFSLPFPLVCPTSFFALVCPPIPMSCLVFPTCVMVATHQHCALLCCFLSSLLFLCLFHHHHPSSPLVCVKRVCVGNGKEDEQTCVVQKACGKRGQKEKQKTTCGVNTLSPTLVPTTPTHPSLHSSHHKSCFPLVLVLALSLLLLFGLVTRGEWFV